LLVPKCSPFDLIANEDSGKRCHRNGDEETRWKAYQAQESARGQNRASVLRVLGADDDGAKAKEPCDHLRADDGRRPMISVVVF
jgi:hypothetical protein